jgi:Na+/pantothenate symporter
MHEVVSGLSSFYLLTPVRGRRTTGAAMLKSLSGTPYALGVVILALVSTSYSLIDGLRSSIRAHVLQLLIIFAGMGILVHSAVYEGGGLRTSDLLVMVRR